MIQPRPAANTKDVRLLCQVLIRIQTTVLRPSHRFFLLPVVDQHPNMYSKSVYVSLFLAGAHLGSATYDLYSENQYEYPETLSSLSLSKYTGGHQPTGISATGTRPIGTGTPVRPTYTSDYEGDLPTSVYEGDFPTSGYGGDFPTTSGYGGIPTGAPVPSGSGGKCTMDSCGDLSAIGWQITCAQTPDSKPTQPPQPTGTGGGYNPQPTGGYEYRMRRKRTGHNYNGEHGADHGYGAGSFDGRPICYKYIYDCDPTDEEVSAPE